MTTTFSSRWIQLYPDLFTDLPEAKARSVVSAIDSAVLEGWSPTRADIATQVQVARGELTPDDLIRRARDRARHAAVS